MNWRFLFEKLGVSTLVISACALGFFYVEHLNQKLAQAGQAFTPLETWLDAYIPFVPQFIYPYYLYYVWIILVIPILRERQHFYHAVGAFSIIQSVAIAMYIWMPSMMVRPEVIGDTLAHDLTRWMYHLDPGFNIMPSMHVGHSVLVALFYWHQRSRLAPVMALGTLLISVSTVLVKQHYIIDLPVGFIVSIGAFYLTAPISQFVAQTEQTSSSAV